MSKTKKILAVLLVSVFVCSILVVNSCTKIDETVDDIVDSYLADLYSSTTGLTIKVEGDKATITDFGTSSLGSNHSVIGIGDVYIKNIKRTGPATWSAEIIEGDYNLSYLKSVSFVSTDLSVSGDNLTISNPDKWDITWKHTTNPGTGNNGNGNGSTVGDTIYNEVIEGDMYDEKILRFNVPAGIKTLTVMTTEIGNGEKNSADMFVSKGTDPTIDSKSPYTYTAQCASIKPNRENEVCTFSSPGSGQWSVLLYGYNTYFFSRLIIITSK